MFQKVIYCCEFAELLSTMSKDQSDLVMYILTCNRISLEPIWNYRRRS